MTSKERVTKEEALDLYCMLRLRPSWRGYMHRIAFVSAPLWGWFLMSLAQHKETVLSCTIFLFSLIGLFGASSSYHRNEWTVSWERFMGRLDYSFIFFVVGFSFVPTYVALLPNVGWTVVGLLAITVILGVVLSFSNVKIGKHALVLVYIAQAIVQLIPFVVGIDRASVYEQLTGTERFMFYAMGVLYLVGSQVYANQWPSPSPKVFGYHEIWHLFIVLAASCSYYINASVLMRV